MLEVVVLDLVSALRSSVVSIAVSEVVVVLDSSVEHAITVVMDSDDDDSSSVLRTSVKHAITVVTDSSLLRTSVDDAVVELIHGIYVIAVALDSSSSSSTSIFDSATCVSSCACTCSRNCIYYYLL